MKTQTSHPIHDVDVVTCHACGQAPATVRIARVFLCGRCAGQIPLPSPGSEPIILCDRCGRSSSVRSGDRFLCAACALKSSQMGVLVLARLIDRYATAVGAYLDGAKARGRRLAESLGREAAERRAGPFDLAVLHHAALGLALRDRGAPEEVVSDVQRVAVLLPELTGPSEEERIRLRRLNASLQRAAEVRERELASRSRELDEALLRLDRARKDRQGILGRLVTAQEEERRRLAIDLHDDTTQVMAAVLLRIQVLRRHVDDLDALRLVRQLEDLVRGAVERLRHLSSEIRADVLERGGLEFALRQHLERWRDMAGVDYELENHLTFEPFDPAATVIFRVALEALRNVEKHAGASRVQVRLEERDVGILVQVRDDGKGFVPEEGASSYGHLGLTSMRERTEEAGGWIQIDSAPDRGTVVDFWIPIDGRPGVGAGADRGTEDADVRPAS